MEDLKGQVHRIGAEQQDMKRRLEKLESNDQRHEEDIRHLYENQAGTKAYVTQILQKIDSLETKLFNLITQITAAQANERKEALEAAEKERKEERKERSSTSQGWQDLIKYVIGATIGIVVLYLFQTGGGK